MTYQQILEGILRNRSNLIQGNQLIRPTEIYRKVNEIEWALQALAEKLRDEHETQGEDR